MIKKLIMKRAVLVVFCLYHVTSFAQFRNFKLADGGSTSLVNPSVAISKKHPNNIITSVGANRIVMTLDSGRTWNEQVISSSFGFAGTTSLVSDAKGEFYLMHSSDASGNGKNDEGWLDRIVLQKSDNKGTSWTPGTFVGLNPPKNQTHQWTTLHPKKQTLYTTWTEFDSYELNDVGCHSNILFSMSSGGNKWNKPVLLSQTPGDCNDREKTSRGAMSAVAIDDRVYATWANQGTFYFDRSYDEGKTWLTNDLIITRQPDNWMLNVPGIKPVSGEPVLIVDYTQTRVQGSLYITYADQKNGMNDTDVWIIRSITHGDNWTVPIRINKDEPGKHQFKPWITVDQTTGFIYIVYYDRRAYGDNQTDVYLAYSVDGGNKFNEVKISETPFTPDETNTFVAHTSIDAHAGLITVIWTRIDNGKTTVWGTVIKEIELARLERKK